MLFTLLVFNKGQRVFNFHITYGYPWRQDLKNITVRNCTLLERFRVTDVGEASEPEGCSSRCLPNNVTRALIEYFSFLFIDKTFNEGEAPPFWSHPL